MKFAHQFKYWFKGVWRFAVIFLVIVLAIYGYWRHQLVYPSTNDASVAADVASIASPIDGLIEHVNVSDNQLVTRGTQLFTLDSSLYRLALANAENNYTNAELAVSSAKASLAADLANIDKLKAGFTEANTSLARMKVLAKRGTISQSTLDDSIRKWSSLRSEVLQAQKNLQKDSFSLDKTARNNLKIAEINVAKAKQMLKYSTVKAKISGYVTHMQLQPGSPVTAYQKLFSIIPENDFYLKANFLESTLRNIKPGQCASIRFLTYPNKVFKGRVDSIGFGIATKASADNSALPVVEPGLSWLRITRRFLVSIKILDQSKQYPLRIGASAYVKINTVKKHVC